MPHNKSTRFNLAQFMKDRKVARQKAVSENRKLLAEYKKVQRAQEKRQDDIFNLSFLSYLVLVLCESFMFRILENFVRKHYRLMWECMYREACISMMTGWKIQNNDNNNNNNNNNKKLL